MMSLCTYKAKHTLDNSTPQTPPHGSINCLRGRGRKVAIGGDQQVGFDEELRIGHMLGLIGGFGSARRERSAKTDRRFQADPGSLSGEGL